MFFKGSRYKRLNDETTHDAEGRARKSKELRLAKAAEGTFIHYLSAEDRLDHLAYKYYRQPQKWWRICDANGAGADAEPLSPLALLGQEPVSRVTYLVVYDGPKPAPLPQVMRCLLEKNGITDVKVERAPYWETGEEEHDGVLREIITEIDKYEITVQFHDATVTPPEIENVITQHYFSPDHCFIIQKKTLRSRLGKPVHIPPRSLE